MKRPNLSIPQREQIADLRINLGWGYNRIAEHLDVSPGAVSWYCLMDGIERYGVPGPVREIKSPAAYRRGAHIVRPYAPEDDALLLVLEAEGKTYSEIARAIDRRHNSIAGRLATLARREERREAMT